MRMVGFGFDIVGRIVVALLYVAVIAAAVVIVAIVVFTAASSVQAMPCYRYYLLCLHPV